MMLFSHTGWAEQNPLDWWDMDCDGLKELIADTDSSKIAGIGCGEYASVYECSQKIISVNETIYPTPELVKKYESKYQKFTKIYPVCKGLFAELQGK